MKAEERHEMRESDLSNWLQYGLWAFIKQNGSYILLIAALCFLGYRIYDYYQQKKETERVTAYQDYDTAIAAENLAPDPKDPKSPIRALQLLPDLIENSPVKDIKGKAALKLGRLYGAIAISPPTLDSMNLTRAAALSKAFDAYSKALEVDGDDPLIAAEAHFGIAAVYEDQGGAWDKAKAEYQLVIDGAQFAGPLANLAKERLSTLDDRKNAPRLAAWTPPATAPLALPTTRGGLGDLPSLPGGLTTPTLPEKPTTTSPFTIGPMLGPPSGFGTTTLPSTSGTPLFNPASQPK